MFPLIAVARKLREVSRAQGKGAPEFLFIGPAGGFKDIFKKEWIVVRSIFTGKLRRYFSFLNFLDVLLMPVGFLQVYWHVFLFMPDVVFAKGGYGSLPAVLIAWIFRIPVVIHESDIIPGLSNRIVSRFAKRIIISFDEAASFFPKKKTVILGNPVRDKLFSMPPDEARGRLFINSDKPVLFVLGGSQGAKQINDLVLLALPDIVKKYEIIHQCGDINHKEVQEIANLQIKGEEEKAMYHPYSTLKEEELASAYSVASVIISRAGSGAIFEIASSMKPSILIPYAPAAGGHQEKNAHIYAKTGAALLLEGENIKPHMLINAVDSIIKNPEKAKLMNEAARNFAKPDATKKIAELVLDTING